MKKRVKIIIIVLSVIVVIGGGLVGLRTFLHKDKTVVQNYTVNKEIYENVIEISGTVSAAQQQTLNALGAGTVMKIYVKAGDKVKKGDLLVQLDDSDEVYNLEKHDYNMATTRLNGSPRDVSLMETQRVALVQKIADRKVVAAFDGVIVEINAAEGNSVKAGDKIGTLVNLDYLTAEVEIPETDVAKLQVGLPVILNFSASSKEGNGYVESWPAIGELTNRGASIVRAKIRIDDYPKEILPNYSFTGKIQIEEPVENITVERYAIGYEDGKAYVILARGNEKRYVEVEQYGRNYVKILSGLKGGEVLLQAGEIPKSGSATTRNQGGNNNRGNGNNGNNRSGGNNNNNRAGASGGMPAMPSGGAAPSGR
ncbi:MAG: HlyD family efflux transporter periplasmic adaptor subunit [Treponema sp.]|nr:HlyD family efflux transporter periplasmic adaptor subunit [Treponema sp.]